EDHSAGFRAVLREFTFQRRDVVVGDVRDARRIRSEAARILGLSARGDGKERATVETVQRGDDAYLLVARAVVRIAARELQRSLIGFRAGVGEENALGERVVDEALGEPQGGLA